MFNSYDTILFDQMEPVVFTNANQWRAWLTANHYVAKEVWLIHFKVRSKQLGLRYKEALDEALCFGWIDSKGKSLDTERFILRYTPRKASSIWSLKNKNRALELISLGKMAEAGLKSVEVAKANGTWDGAYTDRIAESLPEEFASLLSLNKHASQNFICFPTSSRNMYVRWIRQAKTATTRQSRINTVIKRSEKNLQPGEIE